MYSFYVFFKIYCGILSVQFIELYWLEKKKKKPQRLQEEHFLLAVPNRYVRSLG